MKISIIVAKAEKNVIGGENKLLWHLPADLKFFKEKTSGHHILMGRKTFESIGKALPNRVNLVLTRDENYKKEGVLVVKTLQQAIDLAQKNDENELFIIGGGEIYKNTISIADTIYITQIDAIFEGDTFFPALSSDWKLVSEIEGIVDEKNKLKHRFLKFERN
ncbi:MAG: dihydrofolate reductase [Bacteroidetes bacterium]|nr:MAG: dihydrofolate reductase [Bacteroidota bacterium]